jgi:hypothetical protein
MLKSNFTSQVDIVLTATETQIPVTVIVEFDGTVIFDATSDNLPKTISHTFDDNGGNHLLSIRLKNKTDVHTHVDTQGNILSDVVINIDKFNLDYVNITDFFNLGHCDYIYDDSLEVDKFWGVLGRNGVVNFPFASPAYTWLIKNYQHWTPNENS